MTGPVEEWPPHTMASWLARTADLQRECFGGDPADITDPTERAAFCRRMVLGLIVEATEALNEVDWKWWRSGGPGFDRDRYVEELVDVVHFVGALARAAGVTDREWDQAYAAKTAVVRARASWKQAHP